VTDDGKNDDESDRNVMAINIIVNRDDEDDRSTIKKQTNSVVLVHE
jgi:hypothetical protein